MYDKMFSGTSGIQKDIVLKLNPFRKYGNRSWILKNKDVLGSPKEQFGVHKKIVLGGGRGVQGTLKYLSVQGMIAFTIHLAPNKCPYVYNMRYLFAVNLNIYRQDCRNSAHSAYSIVNRTAWSPTGYAHPATLHAHCIIHI